MDNDTLNVVKQALENTLSQLNLRAEIEHSYISGKMDGLKEGYESCLKLINQVTPTEEPVPVEEK